MRGKQLILIIFVLNLFAVAGYAGAENGTDVSVMQLGRDHFKCGFPAVLQANFSSDDEQKDRLKKYVAQNAALSEIYISPSGHFNIHYSTTGYDAIPAYDRDNNGTPDYLEFIAKSFDRAWRIEIDSLGFNPPPDLQGNPRNSYDVYCRLLNYYGETWWDPDPQISEIPSLPGLNFVTSINISTNFNFVNYPGAGDDMVRDSMAIAVTAAHEFNHSLQTGYRLWGDTGGSFYDLWFIESSAVFMEEVVCPEVNDYLFYLPYYMRRTGRSIDDDDNSLVIYGRVALPLLLGEKFGKNITRKIWERIRDYRALPAMENVLDEYAYGVSDGMNDLAEWLYFSADRAIENAYFNDASLFGELNFKTAAPLPGSRDVIVQDSLPRNAFQWYQSDIPVSGDYQLLLKNTGNSPVSSHFLVATPAGKITGNFTSGPIPLSNTGAAAAQYAAVNRATGGEDLANYEIWSSRTGEVAEVFPQPFKYSANSQFLKFEKLPEGARIHIYSANGKLLRSDQLPGSASRYQWDLRTGRGDLVGSGVYIYQAETDDEKTSGKFVIIR